MSDAWKKTIREIIIGVIIAILGGVAVAKYIRDGERYQSANQEPIAQKSLEPTLSPQPSDQDRFESERQRDYGDDRSRKKEFYQAISHYEKAIKLDPSNYRAYYERGKVYYETSQLTEAMADFNQADRILSSKIDASDDEKMRNFKIYYYRGLCYLEKKQLNEAIGDFSKSIYTRPDRVFNNGSYASRGRAYYAKGEFDKAITDFDMAIDKNFSNYECYLYRGDAYCKKGQFDKAIADYNENLQQIPYNPIALRKRANAYNSKCD